MRRWIAVGLSFLLILGAAGCGSDDAEAGAGKRIGIFLPDDRDGRWLRDGSYLQRQFERLGYDVTLEYASLDEVLQARQIDEFLADHAELLIIAPAQADSLGQVLIKAREGEIPVIAYDRIIQGTDAVDYYVSFDNYEVGRLQGEFVISRLEQENVPQPWHLELFAGDVGDNNTAFFYQGAWDVIAPYLEDGRADVPSGETALEQVTTLQWAEEVSRDRMGRLLNTWYADGTRLDAVISPNDGLARGIIQAIRDYYPGENRVVITGQDGDDQNMPYLEDGQQSMTVFKALSNEAVVALDLGEELLKGFAPGEDLTHSADWDFDVRFDGQSFENGEKVIPAYLLEPIVITPENIEKELLEPGFYVRGKDGSLHPES